MSPDKLKTALNNFKRHDLRVIDEPQVSVAEHRGLKPPPLSNAQRAGFAVEGALAAGKFNAKIAAAERFREEKAEFEKKRDDAIFQRIQSKYVAI